MKNINNIKNIKNIKNISILLIGMLSIIPLIIFPSALDYFYFPKLFVTQAFVLCMIGIHILSEDRLLIKKDLIDILLEGYGFLVLISIFFSIDARMSILGKFGREEGFLTLVTYFLIFILSRNYLRWKEKYLRLIIGTAVIVSIYGIIQYFDMDPVPRDFIREHWRGRVFSTMGNPNFLSSYLLLILPFTVFEYLKSKKNAYLLSLSIIYTALLLTFTRSAVFGISAIAFFTILYVIKKPDKTKTSLVILFTMITLTVGINILSDGALLGRIGSLGPEAAKLITKSEGYEKAGANRVYIWTRVIPLVKERPVWGYGLETLDQVFVERYSTEMLDYYGQVFSVDRAHNELLHIAVSTGIPSLMFYLGFLLFNIKSGLNNLIKDYRYYPFVTAVIGYSFQAMFNISVVSVAFIFWAFLGAISNNLLFDDSINNFKL